MTPHRLIRSRVLAGACVLFAAGLVPAGAQFLPSPGQDPAFPPPPGQSRAATPQQDSAFPPPPPVPGQVRATSQQDPAFPPPPGSSGGSGFVSRPGSAAAAAGFGPAPSGGFGPAPSGGFGPAPSGGVGAAPGGGFGGQQGPSEAQRVCLSFPPLRQEVESEFKKIKAASDRHAPRDEACGLFKTAVATEGKMLKFLETHRVLCGVPQQAINQVKTNHSNTIRIRNQLCSSAPGGPAAGPSLSDVLGAPVVADDTDAKKPGRGTFDTLTGNVLSR